MLLAHTMDDQAETVLIGLLRSRGVDALAGMPQVFTRSGVTFARPLLTLTRDEPPASVKTWVWNIGMTPPMAMR